MRRVAPLILLALAVAVAFSIAQFGALEALTPLALGLLGLCALLSWVFVLRHSRTRWWATAGGRYLMKSKTALALLFSLSVLNAVVPLRPLTAVVLSVALFGWIAYVLLDLLVMQTGELRTARAEKWIDGPRDIARDADRDLRRDGPRDIARDIAHDDTHND